MLFTFILLFINCSLAQVADHTERIRTAAKENEVIFGRAAFAHARTDVPRGVYISLATINCATAAFRFVFPEDTDYQAHVEAWNNLFSLRQLPLISSIYQQAYRLFDFDSYSI